jgi:hypothetical protein
VSYSNSEKQGLSEIGDARLVFGAQGAGGYVQRDAVACGLCSGWLGAVQRVASEGGSTPTGKGKRDPVV